MKPTCVPPVTNGASKLMEFSPVRWMPPFRPPV
jgi:hypothetical protein